MSVVEPVYTRPDPGYKLVYWLMYKHANLPFEPCRFDNFVELTDYAIDAYTAQCAVIPSAIDASICQSHSRLFPL